MGRPKIDTFLWMDTIDGYLFGLGHENSSEAQSKFQYSQCTRRCQHLTMETKFQSFVSHHHSISVDTENIKLGYRLCSLECNRNENNKKVIHRTRNRMETKSTISVFQLLKFTQVEPMILCEKWRVVWKSESWVVGVGIGEWVAKIRK